MGADVYGPSAMPIGRFRPVPGPAMVAIGLASPVAPGAYTVTLLVAQLVT